MSKIRSAGIWHRTPWPSRILGRRPIRPYNALPYSSIIVFTFVVVFALVFSVIRFAMPALDHRAGLLLVVISAIAFAASPSLARLAYDGGSDPATAALFRFTLGAAVLFIVHRLRGGRLRLDRRLTLIGLAAGLIYAAESLAYLFAVRLIPVSVTVLVFFTFPVFVALLVRLIDKVPVTPVKTVSLVAAFTGVALTTGAAPQALDPLGLGLALFAAIGTAVFILLGGQLTRAVGSIGFALISFAVATVVFGGWTLLAGSLNLPETPLGWFGLVGGSLTFVMAIVCFFTALKVVETVTATLISNLEPIVAIAIAYLVLGEILTLPQMVGGAIVVGAILLPGLVGTRPQR